MGHNSPEWLISFMGSIFYNCIASGVYPTNNSEACFYQAEHSEAELIVVDSVDQLKKYLLVLPRLPKVKAIVIFNVATLPKEIASDKRIFTWDNFLEIGKMIPDEVINQKIEK